jgi:hypothetical protein
VQVIEQAPALSHHHQQSTPGTMVLVIFLQMFRQMIDPLSQKGNLHIGRPGVRIMQFKTIHGFSFRFHKGHCRQFNKPVKHRFASQVCKALNRRIFTNIPRIQRFSCTSEERGIHAASVAASSMAHGNL